MDDQESVPTEPRHRSPSLAWLISLILPGAGQIYCGKSRRGILTLLCFGLAAATFAGCIGRDSLERLVGLSIRVGLFLYAFASLDAYCTAQEINASLDGRIAHNPRVAAVLNLLTKGFGYYYLGRKREGVLCAALLNLSGKTLAGGSTSRLWLDLGVEIVSAAIAIHAYRIARAEIARLSAEASVQERSVEPDGGLPRAIPWGLAGMAAIAYVALIALGALFASYREIDQSRSSITESSGFKVYTNPRYGLQMSVPASWGFDETPRKNVAVWARAGSGDCLAAFLLEGAYPWQNLESLSRATRTNLLKADRDFEFKYERPGSLGGLPAEEIGFLARKSGHTVAETLVVTRKRCVAYTLSLTELDTTHGSCGGILTGIWNKIWLSE